MPNQCQLLHSKGIILTSIGDYLFFFLTLHNWPQSGTVKRHAGHQGMNGDRADWRSWWVGARRWSIHTMGHPCWGRREDRGRQGLHVLLAWRQRKKVFSISPAIFLGDSWPGKSAGRVTAQSWAVKLPSEASASGVQRSLSCSWAGLCDMRGGEGASLTLYRVWNKPSEALSLWLG